MSLLRFFLSCNRIPLILFTLFGFFFNLFYNTNILGICENFHMLQKLEAFDKHGHVSKAWFYNTITLANCCMGISMAVFHSMTMSSILFNAKYRVVSVLVHFLRIRNIILPLITIFCELVLFHDQTANMSGFQSKIMHQANALLVPTILYGLAAIMLYSTYDRYLMEIRLIFDYLTLSLRCTRGLSPLEEQTYICEAINLHACRETMVLEQREKAERDLKEMMRREKDRIHRERLERTRAEEQRLSRVQYENTFVPEFVDFLRTIFGLQRMVVDEDNIPPSIRTGIEKQKDELRICAAKTMCCSIQKNFKDKKSILPNCLQGISRAKINLCDLKDKDLCGKLNCVTGSSNNNSLNNVGGSGAMQAKNRITAMCSGNTNNKQTNQTNFNVFSPNNNSTAVKKEDANCISECQRQTDEQRAKSKKREMERERKEQEKCERELKARQIKCEKEERKKRQKAEEDVENQDGAVSIFNDLPRTDLVMNCEIKRVLDPDCQEVLRCKEVIVPPPACALGDKGGGGGGMGKHSPAGPRQSPVGQPFGTVSNCNQKGMAQRLQPMYHCANSGITTTNTCSTGSTGSFSTNSCSTAQQNRGRQMDGMNTSMSSVPSSNMAMCGLKEQTNKCDDSSCRMMNNNCAQKNTNHCDDTCSRMVTANQCQSSGQRNSSTGPAFTTARSQPMNKTSVQAIPVQVTLTEPCNYPIGPALGASQMEDSLYRGINARPMTQYDGKNSGGSTANSFSNAGAATPLEAQNRRDICNDSTFMGLRKQPGRFTDHLHQNEGNWRTPGSFVRHLDDNQPENWRSAGSFLKYIKQVEANRFGRKEGNSCSNQSCKNVNCSQRFDRRDDRSECDIRGRRLNRSASAGQSKNLVGNQPNYGSAFQPGTTNNMIRSTSLGPINKSCCSKCNNPHSSLNDAFHHGASSSRSRSGSPPSANGACSECEDTPLAKFNRSRSSGCNRNNNGNSCVDSGSSRYNGTRKCNAQCGSSNNACQLKGGSEETPERGNNLQATTISAQREDPLNPSCSGNTDNNRLTETKREVFKTVTNIDDPSGKVIRKECDTVIEEILHSSAVPGESKTLREVTVEKNIIQEANKTIREESHNTREEIINFEMHAGSEKSKASDAFESRKQRLDMMRRMGSNTNCDRHVSEERHIYGRLKGSPDMTEVQSEAEVRSRVDHHHLGATGLKGGSVDKRGQSEMSIRSNSEEELKHSPTFLRAQSAESVNHNERYYGKGDFCREFTAHLENSHYGELINELKSKLVHLKSPEEMHKVLEQIVLLQTEALVSFVPREGKKYPRDIVRFDPDLSYSALMKELKSVMKTNGNQVIVSKAIKDIDAINAEIEKDMRRMMGVRKYQEQEDEEQGKGYPNHYAFAHLIRELREKIRDYEEGALSSRSDEEVETQEQRRQRIEVLRDELDKRKRMLGMPAQMMTEESVKNSTTSERVRQMRKKIAEHKKEIGKQPSPTRQVTIREPKDMPQRGHFQEETIYMDPNGAVTMSSQEQIDPIHSVPSTKELLKCSKEVCKKQKSSLKSKGKNVVAFSEATKFGLPDNTNVKQISQGLGHLMDMLSRARMAKTPKISMTIKPRKASLSQESNITAVDAQSEAITRKKTGQLLGGSARQGIPKTPSNMKMNRAKSFEQMGSSRRVSGKQSRYSPLFPTESLGSSAPTKIDQRTTDFILEHLRSRGKSIKTPSSVTSSAKQKRV